MQVQMIGHASLLVSSGGVTLLSDPWLAGRAFAEGWEQSPRPWWRPENVACTHLWISHEHPDHFSVPTLRSIPAEARAGIHLIVQRALNGDMVHFLRGLGWKSVTELDHRQRRSLAPGVAVQLHQFGLVDSCLTISDATDTIVMLNDCKPSRRGLAQLSSDVGKVSVLCDQYSLAAWAGNPNDHERFAQRQRLVIGHLASHVEALDPVVVVPYASSVRFCQPDNVHMNEAVVTRHMVEAALPDRRLCWLDPGDRWKVGDEPARTGFAGEALGPIPAADKPEGPGPTGPSRDVPHDESIVDIAGERVDELLDATPRLLRRRLAPLGFRSTDGGFAPFVFDPTLGLVRNGEAACVLGLTSNSARAAFAFRWGLETLSISGRFRLEGDELIFQRWKQVAAGVSGGFVFPRLSGWLTDADRRRFLHKRGPSLSLELMDKVR